MTDLAKLRELQSDPHSGLAFMAALMESAPALLDEVEALRAALRTCMNGCEAAINKLETPTTPLPAYHAAVQQARQALGEAK